jgi:hypothetical protein
MNEVRQEANTADATLSELRRSVRRLRWQVRAMALAMVVVIGAVVWNQYHGVVSSFVYTDEFNVPIPTAKNLAQGLFGGIARALDHRSIAAWIGSGLFIGPRARIDVTDGGRATLAFTDSRGRQRLSIGLSEDGSPSIQLFDASGKVAWTAPGGVPAGQSAAR